MIRKFYHVFVTLLLLLSFFVIVSCITEKRNSKSEPPDKTTPLFRTYVRYPPRNLDPAKFDDGGSSFVATQIYCTLFEQTPSLDVRGYLVDKWAINDTRTIYNFKLRDDIFFSNGRKVTADDVEFSLKRLLKKDSVVFSDFSLVKNIQKKSDRLIEIQLKNPFPLFLYYLTTINAAILPKEDLLEKGLLFFNKPEGCGSFIFGSADDSKVVLYANDLALNKPYIRKLELYYNLDIFEAVKKFNNGLLNDISMAWFDSKKVELTDFKMADSQAFQVYFLMLHKEKAPFFNDFLRELFIHMFDRGELIKKFSDKRLELANGLVPRGIVGFNNSEQLYKKINYGDVKKSPKFISLQRNAKLPVDVTLTVSNLFDKSAFEDVIKENGIDKVFNIKLESVSPEEVMDRYYKRYGDAILMGDDLRYPDPYLLFRYFKSDNPYNDVYVKSKIIDSYIDEAISEENKYERAKIYIKLDKEVEHEAVILPIFYGDLASGVIKNNVTDFEKSYGGEDYIKYSKVWLKR